VKDQLCSLLPLVTPSIAAISAGDSIANDIQWPKTIKFQHRRLLPASGHLRYIGQAFQGLCGDLHTRWTTRNMSKFSQTHLRLAQAFPPTQEIYQMRGSSNIQRGGDSAMSRYCYKTPFS